MSNINAQNLFINHEKNDTKQKSNKIHKFNKRTKIYLAFKSFRPKKPHTCVHERWKVFSFNKKERSKAFPFSVAKVWCFTHLQLRAKGKCTNLYKRSCCSEQECWKVVLHMTVPMSVIRHKVFVSKTMVLIFICEV